MHTSSKLNCSERHCICFFMKQKLGNRYNGFQEIAGSTFLAMNLLRKTNDSSLAFSTPTSSNLKFGMAVSLPAAWSSGKSRKATQTPHSKHLRCAAHLHNLRSGGQAAGAGLIPPSERKGAALIQTPRHAATASTGAAKGREPSVVARSETVHRPVPGTTTPLQASS